MLRVIHQQTFLDWVGEPSYKFAIHTDDFNSYPTLPELSKVWCHNICTLICEV